MPGQRTSCLDGSNGHGPPPPSYRQADHTPGHHPAPAMNPHGLNHEREGLLGSQNMMYGPPFVIRRKYWSLAPSYKALALPLGLAALFLLLGFLAGYFSNEAINANLHDIIRHKWALEDAITREAWAVETREHEEKRNREQREGEARQRDGMTWAGLEPNHCLRYGVKEYTATLTHVPLGFNAIEECHKKSIEIHGRQWLPSLCEDQGICGRVTAHWHVNASEAMCTPWWGGFHDKGCVESGIRRHEARLESIQDTTNWEALCSTTPANINGIYYDGPTSCTGWGLSGVWGIWLVDDDTCR